MLPGLATTLRSMPGIRHDESRCAEAVYGVDHLVTPVVLSGEAGTVGIGLQYGGIWVVQVVIDSGDSVIAPQLCSSAPTQSLPLEIASGVEHPVANCILSFVSLKLV